MLIGGRSFRSLILLDLVQKQAYRQTCSYAQHQNTCMELGKRQQVNKKPDMQAGRHAIKQKKLVVKQAGRQQRKPM